MNDIFIILRNLLNDLGFLKNTLTQIIGGFVAGLIGFISAFLLSYMKDRKEVRDKQQDAFIQIKNEISENSFSLTFELKESEPSPPKRMLLTEAWYRNKYIIPLEKRKDEKIWAGLKILYDKITDYNSLCQYHKHLVYSRGETPKQISDRVRQTDESKNCIRYVSETLYNEIVLFKRILEQKSILLGYSKKKDWPFEDCSPDDVFEIPYFNEAKKDEK